MVPIARVKVEIDKVFPLLFAKNIENLNVQEFWKFMELFSEITTTYKDAIDNYLDSYYYEDENGDFSEELYDKFLEDIKNPEFRNHVYYQFIDYIKEHKHIFYATINDFDENFYIVVGQNLEEESTYSEKKNYVNEYLNLVHSVSSEVFKENNIKNIKIRFKEYHDHIEFTFVATKSISEDVYYELIDGKIILEIFEHERISEKFFGSFDDLENLLYNEDLELSHFKNKITVFRENSNHIKVLPLVAFNEYFEEEFSNYEEFQEKAREILGKKVKKIMDMKEQKNIILTNDKLKMLIESAVGSLFKENENEAGLNFNKAYYNAMTKKITAAYYLIEETEDNYKILNIKERKNSLPSASQDKSTFKFEIFEVNYFDLPKKIVNKLDIYPTEKGFFYFEMPYGFYKQNDPIKIERINIAANFKKLIPAYGKTYKYTKEIKSYPDIYNYLLATGLTDEQIFPSF